MKRIYCNETCEVTTEEAKELLLKLYNLACEAQRCFDEENYLFFVAVFYNYIREKFNLPNKVFTIAKSKDNMQVQFVLFPKEPDGTPHQALYDEELKSIYILVEE